MKAFTSAPAVSLRTTEQIARTAPSDVPQASGWALPPVITFDSSFNVTAAGGGDQRVRSPARTSPANTTAWARSRGPALANRSPIWVRTVASLRCSRAAISLLSGRPSPTMKGWSHYVTPAQVPGRGHTVSRSCRQVAGKRSGSVPRPRVWAVTGINQCAETVTMTADSSRSQHIARSRFLGNSRSSHTA